MSAPVYFASVESSYVKQSHRFSPSWASTTGSSTELPPPIFKTEGRHIVTIGAMISDGKPVVATNGRGSRSSHEMIL